MIVDYWDHLLTMPHDVYFTEQYVKLYGGKCFVWQEADKIWLCPVVVNDDTVRSPYGYSGFLSNSTDKAFNDKALMKFKDYFDCFKIVIRFNPFLNNQELCKSLFDRLTACIELDNLEENIKDSHKQEINKAIELLSIKESSNPLFLFNFHKEYINAMDRKNTNKFYFFDLQYFENIKKFSFFYVAKYGNTSIAGINIIPFEDRIHYHLSWNIPEYKSLSGNKFLLYKVAKIYQELGYKYFHLGGGLTPDLDDPLWCFKKRFCNLYLNNYIWRNYE